MLHVRSIEIDLAEESLTVLLQEQVGLRWVVACKQMSHCLHDGEGEDEPYNVYFKLFNCQVQLLVLDMPPPCQEAHR